MNETLTQGGIMAAVVVPTIGLVIWLVRWFAEKHVNHVLDNARLDLIEKRKDFLEAMKQSREDFFKESTGQREMFREEMKNLRDTFQSANTQLVSELRRLSDVLAKHEEVLESILKRIEFNERRPTQ